MKFLHKINKNYFLIILLSSVFISFGSFFIIKKILLNETKENLTEKNFLIKKQIKDSGILPQLFPLIIVKKTMKTTKAEFRTVFIKNELENEEEQFLQYISTEKINGQLYQITVNQQVSETDNLILTIIIPISLLLLSTLLLSFFITKKLNKILWRDFEHNLRQIEQYSFKNNEILKLKDTKIDEFKRLNKILQKVTSKLSKEYKSLKEFTANASHELQTPLSIISLNLEEILQQNISEKTAQIVYRTYKSIKKLSLLSKNLLLLSKVENRQFYLSKNINIKKIIEDKIEELSPLAQEKNIKINIEYSNDFKRNANTHLSEILFNNLLQNAIIHNIKNGEIFIKISQNKISICNTGLKNNLSNDQIFQRFTKFNSHSFGLGLSMVKKICDYMNIKIIYFQKKNSHCFRMLWQKNN